MGIREISAKFILNRIAKSYGEVQDIQFNTSEKIIYLKMLLNGETKADSFQIFYEIKSTAFVIKKIITEKKWHQACVDYFVKKEYKVPLSSPLMQPIFKLFL